MDMDIAYLHLSIDRWIQTIAHKTELTPVGATMRAHCRAHDDYQLTLSTQERITQIPIELDLSVGPMLLGSGRQIERGIGLFNYISTQGVRPPTGIGCYVSFDTEHYNEIWAQVRNGTFTSSYISLDLAPFPEPGEHLWKIEGNRGSLFVVGAAIHFSYDRPATPPMLSQLT